MHVLLRANTKLIENIVCLSKHVQLVNDLSKLLFFNSVIEQVLFLCGGKKLMKQCYLWSNQYAESLAEQSYWWLINQVDVGNTAGYNYSSQEQNPHETLSSDVSYLSSYCQEIGVSQGNALGGADNTCEVTHYQKLC